MWRIVRGLLDIVVQKFTNPLPSYEPLFLSSEAKAALERTVAVHFLRTGQFDTAEMFISVSAVPVFALLDDHRNLMVLQESDIEIPYEMRAQFVELHRTMLSLRNGDISLALE